jgi:hypothetical protein
MSTNTSESSASVPSVAIAVRPIDVYAVDESAVEHDAPARRESEFARALEADFRRRIAMKSDDDDDDDNNDNDSVAAATSSSGAAAATATSSSAQQRADETEKQWFEIYQNLKHARGEVEQAGALVEALLARRHLTALHVPTAPPSADMLAQQRRIAVQAKREQLHSAATKIFVHCQSLRSQLAADRVFYGQLQRLCTRWRLVLADNGSLMFDYVPLLTAARDSSSLLERAVCVRVEDGNVALRLPPARALALGRRISVSYGARRLALLNGPIAVAQQAPAEAHGVAFCDYLLERGRHSVWLERVFHQLLRESAVLATDVAYLADDHRESEQRAVCIALSLGIGDRPLSLAFQLESAADASAEHELAAASRKRRWAESTGGAADGGSAASLDAVDEEALAATCAVLDDVLGRLCMGMQRMHRQQLASASFDASSSASAFDIDTRVAKWIANDEDADAKAKPTPSAGGPLSDASARRRSKLSAFFAAADAASASTAPNDAPPVSLIESIRTLFRQCRCEAGARTALARLAPAFGSALACAWSRTSPFDSECRVVVHGHDVFSLVVVDGTATVAGTPVAGDVLDPPRLIHLALRQHAAKIEALAPHLNVRAIVEVNS